MQRLISFLKDDFISRLLSCGLRNRFYLVLISISMLGQYAYAFCVNANSRSENKTGEIRFDAHDSHEQNSNPLDFPLFSEPDTEDSETEFDSELEFENDFILVHSLTLERFVDAARKSASSSFSSFVLNRRTVSLFVLHHSWKNDLA